ncbi:MAG TPA: glycoside hydrolase family 15 protein, partial [Nocardioidaceae bacterium]|nr:glycoside hydrolase family 15 protein [Nocardioidaceae bacterium]
MFPAPERGTSVPVAVERPGQRAPDHRHRGYASLRSYAAIGDGRTVALVAADGAIDWLALPDLDSPSVFGALLDAEQGGVFTLAPDAPYTTSRRYLPGTNVLETTFHTDAGTVRVLDAMTLQGHTLGPFRELQRRVEGVSGRVSMTWCVRPRYDYGEGTTRLTRRNGIPVATHGADALAVWTHRAGTAAIHGGSVTGSLETSAGSRAVIALCAAHQEPLVFPTIADLDERFDATVAAWGSWADTRSYRGPWGGAVKRSALALKLLVHAPSGAMAAAATTSLPEQLGAGRNWDYRFCWVRDAAFTVDALLRLGCTPEAQAYFWWLVHASQLTHPRLQPLYRLDGGAFARERTLALDGYEGSRPVRVGNAAAAQLQLDTYGELLQTAWLYAEAGEPLDGDLGRRLAEIADLVCGLWREPDAGIWEVRSAPAHFTHSKMMCWVALNRAARLAERGLLPSRHRERWCREASAIHAFVEEQCFSTEQHSYLRSAGADDLDASVLLGLLAGYGDAHSARWRSTVDQVRRSLGHGPYLYRYTGEDGLPGTEGAFVSCSFWLAEALARIGRTEDATALMDEL